jgi:hypothetical protein
MFCYGGSSFVIAGAGLALYWWAHRIINALFTDLGIAAAASIAVVAGCLLVTAMAAMIHAIQRRRARAGACITCHHPCQQAQVPVPAPEPAPLPVITNLPWPGGIREHAGR